MAVREWTVAGALLEASDHLLLVRNLRRGGHSDWTTPGGVIDATDADVLAGLTREVEEETGLRVTEWEGPLYEVRAVAPDMGWVLRAHVYRAIAYEGEVRVDDPDGIVVEAEFMAPSAASRSSPTVRNGFTNRSPTGSTNGGARARRAATRTTCAA